MSSRLLEPRGHRCARALGICASALLLVSISAAQAHANGEIRGRKFIDNNGNGLFDGGDTPGVGWRIFYADGAGVVNSVLTNNVGDYVIPNLACGTYVVWEETQPTLIQTLPPDPGYYVITLDPPNDIESGYDFGNAPGSCPQSSLVVDLTTGYDDANQQAIGLGLPDHDWFITRMDVLNPPTLPRPPEVVSYGWPLKLPQGEFISADLNGPNGIYTYQRCFCLDVDAGAPVLDFDLLADDQATVYLNGTIIAQTPSNGFQTVTPVFYNNPATFQNGTNCLAVRVDNTHGVVTGFQINGTLEATGGSCCLNEPAKIKGIKFFDENQNGVRDGNEPIIQDWHVDLSGPNNLSQGDDTDQFGQYEFCALGPGNYTVTENLLPNWTATTGNPVPVNNLSFGDVVTVDFGNFGNPCDLVELLARPGEACCMNVDLSVPFADYFDVVRAVINSPSSFSPGAYTNWGWNNLVNAPNLLEWQYTTPPGMPAGFNSPGGFCVDPNVPGPHTVTLELQAGSFVCPVNVDLHCATGAAGTISGSKFADLDGDGVFGGADVYLDNWGITIRALPGGQTWNLTTDPNGNFVLPALPPGDYEVCEDQPPNYQPTTPPCVIVNLQPGGHEVVNFANLPLCDISITAVPDITTDCCFELIMDNLTPQQLDLVEAQLTMLNPGTIVSSTPDPAFNQTGPAPTTVSWQEVGGGTLPGGNSLVAYVCFDNGGINPAQAVVDFIAKDGTALCFDYLEMKCQDLGGGDDGVIKGHKFNDLNGDGVWDTTTEPGLQGWSIVLTDVNGNSTTVTTNANGEYVFTNVADGAYTVSEVQQQGWTQTAPPSGVFTIVIQNGSAVGPLDFGNQEECLSISDDTVECGQLTPYVWQLDLTNLSDDPAGVLIIHDVTPAGVNLSPNPIAFPGGLNPGATTSLTIGIDGPGAVNGATVCFAMTLHDLDGESCCVVERCIELPECHDCDNGVQGMKFRDRDGDGVKDPGERGLANWDIVITDAFGFTQTVTTDAWGNYFFTGLGAGTYTVSEVNRPGWTQTAPPGNVYTLNLSGGAFATNTDFGNVRRGTGVVVVDPTGVTPTSPAGPGSAQEAAASAPAARKASFAQQAVPMLSFALEGDYEEPLKLEAIALAASGSGDDARDVERVRLFADIDGDGVAEAGEPQLGEGFFLIDDGVLRLALDAPRVVPPQVRERFVVTYDFAAAAGAASHPTLDAGQVDGSKQGNPFAALCVLAGLAASTLVRRRRRILSLLFALAFVASCAAGSDLRAPSYALTLTDVEATGAVSGDETEVQGALPISGAQVFVE